MVSKGAASKYDAWIHTHYRKRGSCPVPREDEIEILTGKFGEVYRRLITSSLDWLRENEPRFGLTNPIAHFGFVKELVRKAKKGNKRDGK